jgi:hypothetical protein
MIVKDLSHVGHKVIAEFPPASRQTPCICFFKSSSLVSSNLRPKGSEFRSQIMLKLFRFNGVVFTKKWSMQLEVVAPVLRTIPERVMPDTSSLKPILDMQDRYFVA